MTKTRTDGSVTMHGPVEFYIVTRANIPDLVERAAARDVGARTTLRGINGFVIAQLETKRGKGRMCLMCDFEFNQKSAQPGAFVVMLPMFPGKPKTTMLTHSCVRSASAALINTMPTSRKR